MDWYLGGQKLHTYIGETPQEKIFVLLGLYQSALPEWIGPTDPDLPYPRDFEIDDIRVYELQPPA